MECTLAIKMRIEVLKRKPNSTRILDYLTFLTLTLNSIDDLKIKFFPFTTKPRDAAQKSQKLVNLEMWNLNHTGWGGSRLRSQRSNSSYKEFPSIALLPRSPWTFRQRVSAHRLANALPGPSWELTQTPPKQFPWSHCIAVGCVWKL